MALRNKRFALRDKWGPKPPPTPPRGRHPGSSGLRRVAGGIAWAALAATMAQQGPPGAAPAGAIRLAEVARASGLTFVHRHAPSAERYYVESVPGGLAIFDYNGDGRADVFFTNGAATPSLEKSSDAYANRLYRNDGGMRFTDVTDAAGVRGTGYEIGRASCRERVWMSVGAGSVKKKN